MIVVKLKGGLGNQLFQYAIAKKISLRYNVDVVLDITAFENYKLHKYSLDHFDFKKRIASDRELALFGIKQISNYDKYYVKLKKYVNTYFVICENQFNFDKNIFAAAKKNTYLEGYFQSEKYFLDIRDILLTDFKIIKPLVDKNLEFANKIFGVNAISLHIRRGDYVTNKDTLNIHGICDLLYYKKAIEYISNKIEDPVFFIFSDDIPWVKGNLKTSFKTAYVEHNNADTNFEDLRLMSLCKHNIIANSSFSWWGAWLNQNPDKIVIAPKKWFNVDSRNSNDIIPDNWIKL